LSGWLELVRPNDNVRGPISRTLCAGYNRGTLGGGPQPPENLLTAAPHIGDRADRGRGVAVHLEQVVAAHGQGHQRGRLGEEAELPAEDVRGGCAVLGEQLKPQVIRVSGDG